MVCRNRSSFALTNFIAVALAGCTAAPVPLTEAPIAVAASDIINGHASPSSQNAVVMLQIDGDRMCSGTLIANNLVLTARHCVSQTDETLSCGESGRATSGGQIHGDFAPSSIAVYGGNRQTQLVVEAHGAEIIHDTSHNLCAHDAAFVLLDRPINDMPIARVHAADDLAAGATVTAIGWGLTQHGTLPVARQTRRAIPVIEIGPARNTPPNEFMIGEASCSGDSGGPALDAAGDIVGVVSNGGNGNGDPTNRAGNCIGNTARNFYTRITAPGFAAVLRRALAAAAQTS